MSWHGRYRVYLKLDFVIQVLGSRLYCLIAFLDCTLPEAGSPDCPLSIIYAHSEALRE